MLKNTNFLLARSKKCVIIFIMNKQKYFSNFNAIKISEEIRYLKPFFYLSCLVKVNPLVIRSKHFSYV